MLLITVYLIISGIPAIRKIGLVEFLTGETWDSTGSEPQFGILPFILTSVYGTAGAIVIGAPIGFFTAIYLSKLAPKKIKTAVETAVSLLAGIPSVVYGLVGMLVLVPCLLYTSFSRVSLAQCILKFFFRSVITYSLIYKLVNISRVVACE